ncbi:TonB-dependent receptor plug domain-containing protein [Rhodocytophaga rosea]|uniref:TonB-dependent receptor plug domain-containing protein n=1 Tax=Rhodocytophaga rosea TaxID=2704465 RepID=A0A6C0GSV3_9BACT|nr:carboxypeptidase-like regulatory domain-containing protein [Rhodocytophaga rosea]QHT70977.1 TonB-dependent receptor plug domain-containing protein [Rhodocytophaga rosea]
MILHQPAIVYGNSPSFTGSSAHEIFVVSDSLPINKVRITGIITSSEKGVPVPFANVFLVNTMLGDVTDDKGAFEIRNVPLGTFELMVSYVGFIAQKKTIQVDEEKDLVVNIILEPDQQKLAEVEVKSERDKEWQKQYNRFEKHFLGGTTNASQCTILNPWVVNFSPGEKNTQFKASATAPLEIVNKALGYKLWFFLKRFEAEGNQGLFVGETKFEEITPTNSKEKERWEKNRQKAYAGSIRHFLRSLVRNTWREEGFLAYSVTNDQQSMIRSTYSFLYNEVGRNLTVLKPDEVIFPGRMPFERKLRFPGKIEIIYTKETVIGSPYKDVPHPVTRIKMIDPIIDFTTEGRVYNPTSFEVTGALALEGVADMLPLEYTPINEETGTGDTLANPTTISQKLENITSRFAKATSWRNQQKAYVHTDKPFYVNGETIWLSSYLVESTLHTLAAGDQVLYINLLSAQHKLVQQLILPLFAGRATGSLVLPDTLSAGNYQLMAYTSYMRNFEPDYLFHTTIPVFDIKQNNNLVTSTPQASLSRPDLQFFPEGGHLVAGITSKLAFKAVRPDGKSMIVKGRIIDNNGNRLMSFESNAMGMGKFNFKPEAGKSYQAECTIGEATIMYRLPAVEEEGYVMSLDEMGSGKVRLKLLASAPFAQENYMVIAQSRGAIQQSIQGRYQNGVSFLEFPVFNLPNGICQLTLFNSQGMPVCERLVFINNVSQYLKVQVQPQALTFEPREQASLKVIVTNQAGEPVRTSFSLSVTDAGQIVKGDQETSILTYLLLQSDLKGNIESPGNYFKDRSDSTREALDILMMTQGWRRFNWNDIIAGRQKNIEYPIEKGVEINGKVVTPDRRARPIPQTKITLVSKDSLSLPALYAYSDPEGKFSIKNVPIKAGAKIAFQLSSTRGKTVEGKVILADDTASYIAPPELAFPVTYSVPEVYLSKAVQRKEIENAYSFNNGKERVLSEVVVKSKRLPSQNSDASITRLHSSADAVIVIDDKFPIYATIYQMIAGRVAGVNVQGTRVTIRGIGTFNSGTQPLYIVDGMPLSSVSATDSTSGGQGDDPLSFINPRDVARIEVLKNAGNTGIYGVRGANGVIAIFTKRGYSPPATPVAPELETFISPGYSAVREFYAPMYDVQQEEHARPDKRATLFWLPDMLTDENGQAEVRFYLSDDSKSFQVVLEGISASGQPASHRQVFGK